MVSHLCKGNELQELQKEIKLVPLDLQNRHAWYKEVVCPLNKVPALEHNNEIKGESPDLIDYLDLNFDGPSLYPKDTMNYYPTQTLSLRLQPRLSKERQELILVPLLITLKLS